jgi:tetratricopeptide (TPR) repeat protein
MLQHLRLTRRLKTMGTWRSAPPRPLLLSGLAVVALWACANCRAEQIDLIERPGPDKIWLKGNNVPIEGRITAEDDSALKIMTKRGTSEHKMSEIERVKRGCTIDSEIERLAKKYAGDAHMILMIAKEAVRKEYNTRDNNITAKLTAMLDKEKGSKDPELLTFLTDMYLKTPKCEDKALATAELLVAAAPQRAKSFVLRGLAYLAMNQRDKGVADIDKAAEMAPDDPEVRLARARTRPASESVEEYTRILAKNPKDIDALEGMGIVFLQQSKFKEAEEKFTDALLIKRDSRRALIGMASVKLMTGDPKEAYELARSVLRVANKSWEGYELQAFARLLANEPNALMDFETNANEALRERPKQPRLQLAWAAGLERQAHWEEVKDTKESIALAKTLRDQAEQRYEKLLTSNPDDAYVQYVLGERLFKRGDYSRALPAFARANELAPSYAPAVAALGACALRLGKVEAREAYLRAVELDDSVSEYHAGLGLAIMKFNANKINEAAAEFRKALERDKNNATALCGLGYIANEKADKVPAVGFFQRALAADGTCIYAAQALQKIFKQDGMELDYLTFDDNAVPQPWRPKSAGMVKTLVKEGRVHFAGTQGSTATRAEFNRGGIKSDDFLRLDGDIGIDPASKAFCGIRLSATGEGAIFELEFGKSDINTLKYRYREVGGDDKTDWLDAGMWPAGSSVRLGIDMDESKSGKMRLWVNGEMLDKTIDLKIAKSTSMTMGFYIEPQPREEIKATIDNVTLSYRDPALVKKLEATK